jgi:hypothetical protein
VAGSRLREREGEPDRLAAALAYAIELGVTVAELQLGMERKMASTTTLRRALDSVHDATGYQVAASYDTQLRQILDGFEAFVPPDDQPDLPVLPSIPGFGDLPLTAFTHHAMENFMARAQQTMACGMVANRRENLHTSNPEVHGHTGVWQIGLAARAIGRALKVDGFVA